MTKPTADEEARIAEIRERAEKATPGPWSVSENHFIIADHPGTTFHVVAEIDCIGGRVEDEDFIKHSREDIPYLLNALTQSHQRAIEVVKAKRDEWQQKLEQANTISEEHDARVLDTRNGWRTCVAAASELLRELEG